jgi:hypothetical protein
MGQGPVEFFHIDVVVAEPLHFGEGQKAGQGVVPQEGRAGEKNLRVWHPFFTSIPGIFCYAICAWIAASRRSESALRQSRGKDLQANPSRADWIFSKAIR